MKRITGLLLLSLVFLNLTYGKQIDEMTARTVGQNFLAKRINSKSLKNVTSMELVYTAQSKNEDNSGSGAAGACFYVFNVNSSDRKSVV